MALNSNQNNAFQRLATVLKSYGIECRLVGGAVRDILQGVEPKDIDVAVDATPTEVMRVLYGGFKVIPTGIDHGTITVIVNKLPIEVTSLRIDTETDGRHAKVEYTKNWYEDASRRDLTINAMYMNAAGELYDPFNGASDFANGIIRFAGDTRSRIKEDYLRILRYFRFASTKMETPKFDVEIMNIIAEEAEGLQQISGERIWSELNKILSGQSRIAIVAWMGDSGVLRNIHEAFVFDSSSFRKMEQMHENPRAISALYFIASMLPDIEALDAINSRLKMDNHSYKIISFIIKRRNDRDVLTIDNIKESISLGVSPEMLYHYAVFMGNENACEFLDFYRNTPQPKFPVSGNDLKALGYTGADIGNSLQTLKTRWILSNYEMSVEELLESLSAE